MITVQNDGAVRTVTFDRPEALHAFDAALYRAVASALDDAAADDNVHVGVLTGSGRAFSAGQDLKEMARLATGETTDAGFPDLLDALGRFDKPLIAAVNGLAIGIGFTVLGHCDLVLAAESARFRTPFAQLGVAPEAASSYLFPLRMGWQAAAYVLMTGEWISAAQAQAWGFVFEVVPDGALTARAAEIAGSIASSELASLRAIKQTMVSAHADAIRAARAREDAAFQALLGSAANRAALDGFASRG